MIIGQQLISLALKYISKPVEPDVHIITAGVFSASTSVTLELFPKATSKTQRKKKF